MIPLRDDTPIDRFPALSLALIVANVLVFLFQQTLDPSEVAALFDAAGVVPRNFFAAPDAQAGPAMWPPLTLVTSAFLHAGWLHLIGNLWFLWLFGSRVEAAFGRLLYLPFFLLCGALAASAQIWSDPESLVPMIGASGAVAGVLGAYFVLYPRAYVDTFVVLIVFVRLVRLPALLFLGLWLLVQFTGMLGSSNVAWWAHVGGFVVGALIGLVVRLLRGKSNDLIIGGGRRRASWGGGGRGSQLIRLPRRYR